MLLAFFLGPAFGLQGGAVSAAANNGGNTRPSPDYNRDRGNNKAGQVNRAP
jgi:hypothetical protein